MKKQMGELVGCDEHINNYNHDTVALQPYAAFQTTKLKNTQGSDSTEAEKERSTRQLLWGLTDGQYQVHNAIIRYSRSVHEDLVTNAFALPLFRIAQGTTNTASSTRINPWNFDRETKKFMMKNIVEDYDENRPESEQLGLLKRFLAATGVAAMCKLHCIRFPQQS